MARLAIRFTLSIFLIGLFLLPAGLPAAGTVRAQEAAPQWAEGGEIITYLDPNPSSLRVPAPNLSGPRRNAATFNVVYPASESGIPCVSPSPQAQAAYQYALDIWGVFLNSSVPITVSICWRDLGSGILGSSGAVSIVNQFANQPIPSTFYPVALANALAENDLNGPGTYEIRGRFNSTFNWYFGVDGNPASNQIDFISVALHELAHGMGFAGGMNNSTGILACYTPYPFIYDRFTRNSAGTPLLDLCQNPSALAAALTSLATFAGTNARAANAGAPVPLYTPPVWQQGSSYSHVSEAFNGTPNALMTYSISYGEVVHHPGPITLGILRDLGWSVNEGPPEAPSSLAVSAVLASQIDLGWKDNSSTETGFELERSTDGVNWTTAASLPANTISYQNIGLAGGTRYTFRVRAINLFGASPYSNTVSPVTLGPPPAPSGLSALGAGETRMLLTWTDNSNIETGFVIERKNGEAWNVIVTTPPNATWFIDSGLVKSTAYTYRVRASSAQGASANSNEATGLTWEITLYTYLPMVNQ